MKKRGLILFLVAILSFFSLTGFENDRDFEIVVGSDYYYCYNDGTYDNVTARLNEIYTSSNEIAENVYDNDKLKAFFDNNDVRFFAVSKNDASQIRVAVYTDSVSEKIGDLSQKSDSRIGLLAENLLGDSSLEYEIYRRDAKKYIMVKSEETDAGGSYIVTQFITVYNGKIFNISFYNMSGITDVEKKILDTFEIKETSFSPKTPILIVIFVAIGIAILICIIIFMIWGLIHKRKRPTKDFDRQIENSQNADTDFNEDKTETEEIKKE